MCQGCRIHFMLRPASLLPPWRHLTPRSGQRALAPSLGSATGRSGAYPVGTLTRWRGAARHRSLPPSSSPTGFFRTHHSRNLSCRPSRHSREAFFGAEVGRLAAAFFSSVASAVVSTSSRLLLYRHPLP